MIALLGCGFLLFLVALSAAFYVGLALLLVHLGAPVWVAVAIAACGWVISGAATQKARS